jgi:prepilin-type N-terminal cleavage/methylation domain-containing protein
MSQSKGRRGGVASCRKECGEAGFSLLESLAALFIASITATVIILSFSQVARSVAQTEDHVRSMIVAQQIMNRLRSMPMAAPGNVLVGVVDSYSWKAVFTLLPVSGRVAGAATRGGSGTVPVAAQSETRNETADPPVDLYGVSLDVRSPAGRHLLVQSLLAKGET